MPVSGGVFYVWEIILCYFDMKEINKCISKLYRSMKREKFLQNTVNSFTYIFVFVYVYIYICEKIKVVISVNNVIEIKPQIRTTWYTKKKNPPKPQDKKLLFSAFDIYFGIKGVFL